MIRGIENKAYTRGAAISHNSTTFVPAAAALRPLRDVMIVEPLEATLSAILVLVYECRALKGIVRAIGPGVWLKQYASGSPATWHPTYSPPLKSKRVAMRDSKIFRPTLVKVGEEIELGGREHGGYNFDTFYHGSKLMLICREEDVCAIKDKDGKVDQITKRNVPVGAKRKRASGDRSRPRRAIGSRAQVSV